MYVIYLLSIYCTNIASSTELHTASEVVTNELHLWSTQILTSIKQETSLVTDVFVMSCQLPCCDNEHGSWQDNTNTPGTRLLGDLVELELHTFGTRPGRGHGDGRLQRV